MRQRPRAQRQILKIRQMLKRMALVRHRCELIHMRVLLSLKKKGTVLFFKHRLEIEIDIVIRRRKITFKSNAIYFLFCVQDKQRNL